MIEHAFNREASRRGHQTMGMPIKALVFDVYGTIAEIRNKQRPFKQLFKLMRDTGNDLPDDYAKRLMSATLDIRRAAQCFNVAISDEALKQLEQEMQQELRSIALFADTIPVLTHLNQLGFKLGICSNLAAPYAPPIEQLLPFRMDAYGWSFEVGTVKPDPKIYRHVCQQLGLQPDEVLMVGDTLEADVLGPRSIGMRSIQIVRDVKQPCDKGIRSLSELLELLR